MTSCVERNSADEYIQKKIARVIMRGGGGKAVGAMETECVDVGVK